MLFLLVFKTEPQLYVQFDIWEQGNVSPLQLSDKLQGALRHALCDVVMELRVLPNPLCLGVLCPTSKSQKEEATGEVKSNRLQHNVTQHTHESTSL